MGKQEFEKELRQLINRCSLENGSDTPDFILASYIMNCLSAYEKALYSLETWRGNNPSSNEIASQVLESTNISSSSSALGETKS